MKFISWNKFTCTECTYLEEDSLFSNKINSRINHKFTFKRHFTSVTFTIHSSFSWYLICTLFCTPFSTNSCPAFLSPERFISFILFQTNAEKGPLGAICTWLQHVSTLLKYESENATRNPVSYITSRIQQFGKWLQSYYSAYRAYLARVEVVWHGRRINH